MSARRGRGLCPGGKMAAAASAARVYTRLRELDCPPLRGVYLSDSDDLLRLLCAPSAHRLDILEWICTCVYPPFREQFSSLKDSQSDVKIKEIAQLGSDILLCQADDLDLVKGKAAPQKQLSFMEELLALIPSRANLTGCESGDSSSGPEESFHEAARKNEEFLCEILAGPNLQALLNPECPPWSSDIKPLLHAEEAGPKRARLSARSREKLLLELSKELDEIVAALEALKAQCPFPREDTACPGLSTALQTLKLAASDFVQLIVAFGEVFENELREPCRRAAPQLNACGHLFPAVHRGLALCSQELQALAQVTETSEGVVQMVERQQQKKASWGGSCKVSLPRKVEELRQKYESFQAALSKVLE